MTRDVGPSTRVSWQEYGDAGLLVEVSDEDPEQRWSATQALGELLRQHRPAGLVDVVASFTSVFVSFDPLQTDHAAMGSAVSGLVGRDVATRPLRRFEVPVVYGGDHGPDLQEVGEQLGLAPDEVVDAHASDDWVVRFVASPAGAPLMDGPELPASVPRRTVPRPRVDPGSVGLAGLQSIIYNAASPGGWQLIGRTPLRLFELDRPPHVAYAAGDRLRFLPIAADEADRWAGRPPRLLSEGP